MIIRKKIFREDTYIAIKIWGGHDMMKGFEAKDSGYVSWHGNTVLNGSPMQYIPALLVSSSQKKGQVMLGRLIFGQKIMEQLVVGSTGS
jgi:hypothetical protein